MDVINQSPAHNKFRNYISSPQSYNSYRTFTQTKKILQKGKLTRHFLKLKHIFNEITTE